MEDYPSLARLIKKKDTLVCVDGGLRHADQMNLTPDLLLGDMDSIDENRLATLQETINVLQYPAEKNETDLELALCWVSERDYKHILIAGISGGRLDHTLANIHLLAQRPWPGELCLWHEGQFAWLLTDGKRIDLSEYSGYTLSLLPLSMQVSGVTTIGMQYPLKDATLEFGSTRGISNVVQKQVAEVSILEGILLAIATHSEAV